MQPCFSTTMATTMAMSKHFLLVLSIIVAFTSFSAGKSVDLTLSDDITFPASAGEKFIRALNLLPRDPSPEIFSDNAPPGSIVEKPIRLAGEIAVDDLGHHAGYYRLPHTYDARMFYFFFESRGSKKDPVVIWLTGGPGCSSELAVFYENGPFNIVAGKNMSLVRNEFGWDGASNLIYVDQPTGTGFSYSSDGRDLRHDENGVSNDLYDFIQAFFSHHPEYANNDFYITGESYAGHYIPAFASRVHTGNKAKEGAHINLKGFAIGNGLTDPAIQYKAYADYALEMGIIAESNYKKINEVFPICEKAIELCASSGEDCAASYSACNIIFNYILNTAGNINYYDIRKECKGSMCYDFSNMEKFLNQESVRETLGIGDIEFVSCSPKVYEAMLTDWMRDLEVGIPALLEDGIKLLVYAGEYDLICNWLGNSRWVHAMEWSGQQAFASSSEKPFTVDGKKAGELKSHGPLSFLKVHDAGHMVPMDQPLASLEMLRRWMKGDLVESQDLPTDV